MSATLNAFGMRAVKHPSGLARATAYAGGITSGYNTNLFQGTPVLLTTAGVINVGANGGDIIGVFDGVEYTDTNGRRQYSKMWPANLVATEIVAYVWDDPNTIFEAQAEGSIARTAIADQANFSVAGGFTVGAGNTTTQLSTMALSTTLAGVGVQGMLRIMDAAPYVDNAFGDAFTILTVTIARHQYVSNKVAV